MKQGVNINAGEAYCCTQAACKTVDHVWTVDVGAVLTGLDPLCQI